LPDEQRRDSQYIIASPKGMATSVSLRGAQCRGNLFKILRDRRVAPLLAMTGMNCHVASRHASLAASPRDDIFINEQTFYSVLARDGSSFP